VRAKISQRAPCGRARRRCAGAHRDLRESLSHPSLSQTLAGRGSRAARSSTISTPRRRDIRVRLERFAFIVPSFVMVLGFAAAYDEF
jgi:hypothetical protein